jgi:cellobiose phosphorylase
MRWHVTTKKISKLSTNDGFYLPLFNLKGLKASITPFFGGDLKLDQHHYLLEPTTEIDLYSNIFSRNVIFDVNSKLYFLNGQTEHQQDDELIYETDLLYQRVLRTNKLFTIDTTSYIPMDSNVELHEIKFTNISNQDLDVSITTAVPLYARSADNLRDHRHVTSLLNQIETVDHGVMVKPTLSFDERGHQVNHHIYSVYVNSSELTIQGYIPVLDDFINGGSLHFPKGLSNLVDQGTQVNGYEAMGAISLSLKTMKPNETVTLYMSLGIHESQEESMFQSLSYLNQEAFQKGLSITNQFFKNYVNGLQFKIHDDMTSRELSWVVLQPMLRRYFGNSYLPHHDYGHGGRGWRDLWQDLLALIMMNDPSVYDLLLNNFQGVRMDGSNATIIGDKPGEFKADRNMITRVWSDHGAWPLLTVKMYIDETGDLGLLLKKQFYFMDQFTHYTKKTRPKTKTNLQTDSQDQPYQGTILEHLLLQNLVGHHNIGDHGFVRLEDADWNDGLDMAHKKGETIAFTHMYANNLRILAQLIKELPHQDVVLFEDLMMLLEDKVSISHFFDKVSALSGKQITLHKEILIEKLERLAEQRIKHLQEQAFKVNHFQSYFNNDGVDIDDHHTMNLTGQTMALLSKTASKEQASLVADTTRERLFSKHLGGYHLNSNYHRVLTNMGRAYGFAYNHKENGAIFSHMVIMYAYGLYQYDLVDYGREALFTLIHQASRKDSKMLHGIPEYFTDRGVGKYSYLTGSASWALKLLRTEVFGIKFKTGTLYLDPKLQREDFVQGTAAIKTFIFGKLITVTYHNPKHLAFGSYKISKILCNQKELKNKLTSIDGDLEVYLDELL